MSTKVKNRKVSDVQISGTAVEDRHEFMLVSEIDFSPLNYRRYYSEKGIEELADSIKLYGIIENLTVRLMPSGRYQLVTGERRLRAAIMVSLLKVPVTIKNLTDDEVREIQLVENLHGEDPHPMHEALAIGYMQENRKTVDEIAARLGKSKAFIYSRVKLCSLVPGIQEMFMANIFTLTEALEISVLSEAGQTAFFSEYCADWQKKDHFRIGDLRSILSQFKYNLKSAPFDRKDKQLLPEMGACTKCPYNSATLKSLFPEEAKEAVCTNGECFEKKCRAHHALKLTEIFNTEKPDALLYTWEMPEMLALAVKVVPGVDVLPKYDRRSVSIYSPLQIPDREDFILEYNGDEDDESGFDEQAYKAAMNEYESELKRYGSGLLEEVLKGLHFSDTSCQVIFFSLRTPEVAEHGQKVTAKEVQSALKAGTATTELLEAEIGRINDREERAKELDREKVQLKVHEKFEAEICSKLLDPTHADLMAARLIIFQSLSYSAKNEVMQKIWMENEKFDHHYGEELFRGLAGLSDSQFGYLIRRAVISNAESKYPKSETSYFLYKMAEQSGLDLVEIEDHQKEKAGKRETGQGVKIASLKKEIEKLKSAR